MRINRAPLLVLSVLTVAGVLAGCSQEVAGSANAAVDRIDVNSVSGLPVTNGANGPKKGVPDATLPVRNSAGTPEDRLAVNALSDVFDYWNQAMPKFFDGTRFAKPAMFTSYDSRTGGTSVCGRDGKGVQNAFYCKPERSVYWDRGALLPTFSRQFGPNAVAAVLAHEIGHAVQYQLGPRAGIGPNTPTLVAEQQADCFAGGFFRWAAQGNAGHFAVSTGAGLNKIMAALLYLGDAPGQAARATPSAHGSAFDRIYAFQTGFAGDPTKCAAIDKQGVDARASERLFTEQEREQGSGDVNVATTLPLLTDSLDAAFEGTGTPSPRVRGGSGRCGSGNTPPVSYCPDDNSIDASLGTLQQIAAGRFPSGVMLRNLADKPAGGDFSAFAEVASRYTLAVQRHVGLPIRGKAAGLRSGCLTGAWAAYTDERHGSGQQLRLAAGDLDEAIAEMLQPRSVITDDVSGTGVASGFARVEAFRLGFLHGSAQCAEQFR